MCFTISTKFIDSIIINPAKFKAIHKGKLMPYTFYNSKSKIQSIPHTIYAKSKKRVAFTFGMSEYAEKYHPEKGTIAFGQSDTIIVKMDSLIWIKGHPIKINDLVITASDYGYLKDESRIHQLFQPNDTIKMY